MLCYLRHSASCCSGSVSSQCPTNILNRGLSVQSCISVIIVSCPLHSLHSAALHCTTSHSKSGSGNVYGFMFLLQHIRCVTASRGVRLDPNVDSIRDTAAVAKRLISTFLLEPTVCVQFIHVFVWKCKTCTWTFVSRLFYLQPITQLKLTQTSCVNSMLWNVIVIQWPWRCVSEWDTLLCC